MDTVHVPQPLAAAVQPGDQAGHAARVVDAHGCHLSVLVSKLASVHSSELASVHSSELASVHSSELASVHSSELASVHSSELASVLLRVRRRCA